MADTPFRLARAVAIWLTLVAVESIHGVMRRLLLALHLGDLPTRQMSVLIGADGIASDFDPRRGGFLALGMLKYLRKAGHDQPGQSGPSIVVSTIGELELLPRCCPGA